MCQEAIRLAYLNVGRCGLIGAPTYPMLRDVTQAALFEMLEHNRIPYEFHKSESMLRLEETGSKIIFRSVDEYEHLRGSNLAWFGVDELTYAPEEAWLRLEARLRDPKASRRCGFAVWTPRGYDWVYRKFVSDPVKGYHVTMAKPYENRFLLEKVPDYYDRLKNSYDEHLFKQEAMGEYLHMNAGLVYTAFNRDDHVKDVPVQRNLPLLWSLDFNVTPMASVVAQRVGSELHVVDEIVLRDATTEQACEQLCERYWQHHEVTVTGDASGYGRHTSGGRDYEIVRNVLDRAGIRATIDVDTHNPHVRDRVDTMNAALRSASGRISVYVDKKCKELIKDFEQVTYKAQSVEIDKDRDRYRTHMSDALGYLVWKRFGPRKTWGEQPNPLIGR